MRRLVLAAVTLLALAGCGDPELTTTEACTEVREPVTDAMAEGDVAAAADVLHDVAERGDDEVQQVFSDAAEAADYIADNGNMEGAPAWATMAFESLDSACGLGSGD